MATTASAKKRIRSSARKRERNRVFRSRARTFTKKTDRLIAEGKLDDLLETCAEMQRLWQGDLGEPDVETDRAGRALA